MNTAYNENEMVSGLHYTFTSEHDYYNPKRVFEGIYIAHEDRSYWNEYEGKMELLGAIVIRLDDGTEMDIPDYFEGTRSHREDQKTS